MKTIKTRHIIPIAALIALLITAGCSTEKNTAQSRWWHSFNARYNTYYNGTLAYIDGSLEKETGNKDNFTEMIPLYTVGNKASRDLGKSNFDRAIEKSQKAIKLHSIKKRPQWTKNRRKTEKDIEWLNRKEYNPFLWKAWMLMGRSQFMKGSFDEAASTFAYMSRLYSTQPAIYGRARAWLAKCYIEEGWIYDAEDVITKIKRDSLHWRAVKEWDYTYADYYIHTKRYAEAIPYLRKVIKHEMRRKQRAREWYLMGQLEAALGHKEKAYKAYKRVIRLNPPYELEFNARIAMTEVMAGTQSKKMIRRLKRMAASDNNKDYLDQVYYAIGNIYMLQKDTTNAIAAYEKGNKKSTRNGIEKGVLLLTLGNIYWDKEDYSNAGRCYGEAIGLLDKERDDYERLSERSKVLDELVPYTDAIHLQDSLQTLAKMPEAERNKAIDRVIEALKKKEKEERDAQAELNAQQQMAQQGGMNNMNNANNMMNNTTDKSGKWYFYNPTAVSQGKATFQKMWGRRENVDDWQRVNKTVVSLNDNPAEMTDEMRDSIAAAEAAADSLENVMDSAQNNPHKREYYLKQIPFTEEQVAESNKIIEDGLFHSGIIFKDKLDNLPLSEKNLRRLTDSYPDFENMDEAYYHLYLLYSRRQDKAQANVYLDKLKQNYPESQWTVLLSDPYFEENAKFGEHIEDSLYAATYNAFKAGRYNEVSTNTALSAQRFPLGANRDKFIFIGGLSKLNSGDSNGCLADMEEVVSKYPQSGVSPMAGMIINGVKAGRQLRGGRFDIGDVWAHRSVVLSDSDSIAARKFVAERNTDFTFMIVYSPDSLNENQLLFELARFNFSNFLVRNFDIVIDELNGLHRMKVSGFRNYDEALQYARQLYKNQKVMSIASKGRAIIISDSNIELLGTQYSYNDYDKFYEQHFVPLRISTVRLLTEPATIEFEKQPESEGGNADGLYNGGVIEEGLFINDTQPATGGTDNGISIPVEPENTPATGTQNDNTITIPVEEEKPAGNADDGGIVIPDTQQGNAAGNNNAQQNATQNDGNSFVIEPEQQTEQPATQESQGFEINTDVYDTNANGNNRENPTPQDNNDTGITINTAEPQRLPEQTQPTRQPVQAEPKKEEPAANNDDGLIFEFGDDFNTGNGNANGSNNNNNGNVDNNKQNGYDLEDEYYDLDGF